MTSPVLLPVVTVVAHPVDTSIAPGHPEGCWRWAVMAGGRPLSDMGYCANAGICTSRQEAKMVGQMCGAAAVKALRILGVPAGYQEQLLDYDPVPAEAYVRPLTALGR